MEILKRELSKNGESFVIVEEIKRTYKYNELLNEIQNLQRQKMNLIEQSKRFKSEYDKTVEKELELQTLLNQATENNEFIEIEE